MTSCVTARSSNVSTGLAASSQTAWWKSTVFVAISPLLADIEVVDERRHDLAAVGMSRRELGAQRLQEHLRLHQLSVVGPAEVEVQRGGAGEVGGLDGSHHRPAAGTGFQPDEALHLEEPQRLAQ